MHNIMQFKAHFIEVKFRNIREQLRLKYLYFEKDVLRAIPSLLVYYKRLCSDLIVLFVLIVMFIYYYVKFIILSYDV